MSTEYIISYFRKLENNLLGAAVQTDDVNNLLGAAVQTDDVNHKLNIFICQIHLCTNVLTQAE